jgi:hypothetical protein
MGSDFLLARAAMLLDEPTFITLNDPPIRSDQQRCPRQVRCSVLHTGSKTALTLHFEARRRVSMPSERPFSKDHPRTSSGHFTQ